MISGVPEGKESDDIMALMQKILTSVLHWNETVQPSRLTGRTRFPYHSQIRVGDCELSWFASYPQLIENG